jgi:hypothetical protein
MNQTRLESLTEVSINVAIGWVTGIVTQLMLFPMFNINVPLGDQFWISIVFTVVSIVRSYAIRRWFNAGIHKLAVEFIRKIA